MKLADVAALLTLHGFPARLPTEDELLTRARAAERLRESLALPAALRAQLADVETACVRAVERLRGINS